MGEGNKTSNVIPMSRRRKLGGQSARSRHRRPGGALPPAIIVAALIVFVVGAATILFPPAPAIAVNAAAPAEPTDFSGVVTRVIDGDSLRVSGQGPDIRLWGLDAPEWDENGGAEATAEMRRIALSRKIRCRTMDRDRHGRIVARCYTDSGADITALMIERGVAEEYVRFSHGYYARRKSKAALRKRLRD